MIAPFRSRAGDIVGYKNGEHTAVVDTILPDGHFGTSVGNWGNWDNQVVQQTRVNNGTCDCWNPYPSGTSS